MPQPRHHLAVATVAAALILLQVSFTRLIGYKLFYHFVFLAIALSLLGLGAAGTWVALVPRKRRLDATVLAWLAGFTLLVPLCFLLIANPFVLESDPRLAVKLTGSDAVQYLVWSSFFMVALNFTGGVVLTSIFTAYSARMGALYARDLVGAAIGCLLSLAVMKHFSPPAAFLGAALLSALALPAFLRALAPGESGRVASLCAGLAGVALVALVLMGPVRYRNFQNFRTTNPARQAMVLKYAWNHLVRTDHAYGAYLLDGEASTPLVVWDDRERRRPISEPAYVIGRPRPRVGVVGFGGGPQVAEARRARAERIVAIEINPIIARWVQQEDRGLNQGLFEAPNLDVIVGEGRHALRSQGSKLDVITLHAIDTYAATAGGAYALTENFLYTKEAFLDYFGVLDPGGIVSLSRWLFNPPRENMRLFVTAIDALTEYGVQDPPAHLIMIAPVADYDALRTQRKRVWGYLLASPTPFSAEQVRALVSHVEQRRWSILYAPGLDVESPFSRYVRAPDRRAFQREYPYLISTVTDAKPYLFQFYDPLKKNTYAAEGDWAVSAIYQSSAVLLPVALVVTSLLAFATILLPLLWARWGSQGSRASPRATIPPAAIGFFACLGVGYMALEVPLTQVLALYLGHPTYGFSVALVALLVSSGVGSLLADRSELAGSRICLGIALALVALAVGILPLVHATIALPDPARFGLALAVASACGFPMGFPLALAVRRLGRSNPLDVAWAWGINAAASVIGSCATMIVMVFLGSQHALALGAACYGIAAFLGRVTPDR